MPCPRLRIWFVTVGLLMAGAMSSLAAGGTVRLVDDDAPPGGDGTTWDTAYRFLQNAFAEASGGGVREIRVAQGIYKPDRDEANPNGTGDRKASFQLISGVSLMGGYAGIGAKDPDARDIELYETILSGDLLGNDEPDFQNNAENSYHVTVGSMTDASAILDGFTITAGNADGGGSNKRGGGMFNLQGDPSVSSCTFISNFALSYGGGLSNDLSNPTIHNCVFSGNAGSGPTGRGGMGNDESNTTLIACTFVDNIGWGLFNGASSSSAITDCTFTANSGGGIYNSASSLTITGTVFAENLNSGIRNWSSSVVTLTDCVFTGNWGTAMSNSNSTASLTNCVFDGNVAVWGGGISNSGSVILVDCTLNGNMSDTNAGALSNSSKGTASLINCTITNNAAGNYGGGFYNALGSTLTLVGCTLVNNTAQFGGGVYNNEASLTMGDCVLQGNTAEFWGGGIYSAFSDLEFINCVFAGNSAESGGAIHNFQTSPTLTNCTLTANVASGNGGGIFNQLNANPQVTNCILWNNADSGPTDESAQIFHLSQSQSVVNYSCVQGWTGNLGGEGNIGADPLFVDPGRDDYHLSTGSSGIDAADNQAVPNDVSTDLDGNPRFHDDPCTADSGNPDGANPLVDMGAYEFQGSSCDLDGDGNVGVSDLIILLASWGPCADCDDCPADLSGDCTVGVNDLIILLANWG